jgi:hypothetical protein
LKIPADFIAQYGLVLLCSFSLPFPPSSPFVIGERHGYEHGEEDQRAYKLGGNADRFVTVEEKKKKTKNAASGRDPDQDVPEHGNYYSWLCS